MSAKSTSTLLGDFAEKLVSRKRNAGAGADAKKKSSPACRDGDPTTKSIDSLRIGCDVLIARSKCDLVIPKRSVVRSCDTWKT